MGTVLITGGAGFIGSNFLFLSNFSQAKLIINLDKLTYASHPHTCQALSKLANYQLIRGDIGDRALVKQILADHQPNAVINFAAESHVDRSIANPNDFIQTNVVGTANLLEETRLYWQSLSELEQERFRFIHISTDEVYGSLGPADPAFTETTPYAPNSPYAAAKAGSDHLVRAYFHTYGLPTMTTNCSNNYGPYQFPEKLIPLMISQALSQQPLPIYGDGKNIRDWLYVGDHCRAIEAVLEQGTVGETYNIGGNSQKTNLEVVHELCRLLNELVPIPGFEYQSLMRFVKDRPGHDRRYAINFEKIKRELGWYPQETFSSGLRQTVQWYLNNQAWVNAVKTPEYQHWLAAQYGIQT